MNSFPPILLSSRSPIKLLSLLLTQHYYSPFVLHFLSPPTKQGSLTTPKDVYIFQSYITLGKGGCKGGGGGIACVWLNNGILYTSQN